MNMTYTHICLHCGQDLLMKEINAKECYHAECKKIVAANAARKERESSLHRANARGGL